VQHARERLGKNLVKWHVRDLKLVCNGAMRALAQVRVFGKQVTGIADRSGDDGARQEVWAGHPSDTH
jgi:hypothetical protein